MKTNLLIWHTVVLSAASLTTWPLAERKCPGNFDYFFTFLNVLVAGVAASQIQESTISIIHLGVMSLKNITTRTVRSCFRVGHGLDSPMDWIGWDWIG